MKQKKKRKGKEQVVNLYKHDEIDKKMELHHMLIKLIINQIASKGQIPESEWPNIGG